MKVLTIAVNEDFAQTLDDFLAKTKLYSSRSEFLKDAVREKLLHLMQSHEDIKRNQGSVQVINSVGEDNSNRTVGVR